MDWKVRIGKYTGPWLLDVSDSGSQNSHSVIKIHGEEEDTYCKWRLSWK